MSTTKSDFDKLRDEAKAQGEGAGVEKSIIVDPEMQTPEEQQMSALQVLLSAKPVRQARELKIKKRAGLEQDLIITVTSLTDRQFKQIGEEAEVATGNRGARRGAAPDKTTDNNLFLRLIVANSMSDPNLNSPEVLAAHGAVTAEQVVARVFLPGEIARIAEEVMDLSGWSDDAVEVASD